METKQKEFLLLDDILDEDLLKVRICDLPLKIESTWLDDCINQLYAELTEKGIPFKPSCYLADEWLTPENEPVIGIPFYLAHPTLIRLEKKMMLEAEGDTKSSCMKLLRHETGHALCYAYRFNQRKEFRKLFGSSTKEYLENYRYRPYSKNFVRHLEGFYAQYHPDEDFVETFAVWLTPGLDWRKQYEGWQALKKLQYIDGVMQSIRDLAPLIMKGRQLWHYKSLRSTLENYYKKKRHLRAEDLPDFHDNNLKRIFSAGTNETVVTMVAFEILKKYRKEILNVVSLWTGEKKYVIHNLIKDIMKRCKQLKLVVNDTESMVVLRITSYITTLIMNYVYTGWYRGDRQKKM